jgi:hypothetical protein
MKIFALYIGLGAGIFAIAVYAYSLEHRIKELNKEPRDFKATRLESSIAKS